MQTSLKSKWDEFELATFPDGVSQIQRKEMKKAFFAGALTTTIALAELGEAKTQAELKSQLRALLDELIALNDELIELTN